MLGERLRHTGNGEGLSSRPSLSWVGVGEETGLGVVAGGSPVAAEISIGLLGEEWAHPALVRGAVAVVGSGAVMVGGGFVPARGAGVGVKAEDWVVWRLERTDVGEPIAVRVKGFLVVVEAVRSGKGGEVMVPGCSRSWSSVFASSLLRLRARALEVVLVLRVDFVVVLRAMVVVCLRCELKVVKDVGRGV